MVLPKMQAWVTLPIGLALLAYVGIRTPKAEHRPLAWNPKLAASYLDSRTQAWKSGGAMDHGTFCMSCHTGLPYGLARPGLSQLTYEATPSTTEKATFDSITNRIGHWNELQPYLSDHRAGFSTESVINAAILSQRASLTGKLDSTTRIALKLMWDSQIKKGPGAGSWLWANFGNEPWEAPDSDYWGATLAAVATGTAPEGYASFPAIQTNLEYLKTYLRNEAPGKSLFNRLSLLEANSKIPGLAPRAMHDEIVSDALKAQNPDGGWSTASLLPSTWARHDGTKQDLNSDGYGTGFVLVALLDAGVRRSQIPIRRAITWLVQNQDPSTGSWPTVSPNAARNPSSDVGKFMTDAATAYAVLALSTR